MALGMRCLLLVLVAGAWLVAGDATANANARAVSNGGNAQADARALAASSNGGNADANAVADAISNGGNSDANAAAEAISNGGNADASAKSTAISNGSKANANSHASASSGSGFGPFFPFPNQNGFCSANQWLCKLAGCKSACCHIKLADAPNWSNPAAWNPSKSSVMCADDPKLSVSKKGGVSQCQKGKESKKCTYCCGSIGPVADPIFTDFQNRTFEFFGEPGPTYNVLTHKSTTVNMRLAWAGDRHIRKQEGKGTFTDVLAFKFTDTTLLVEVSEPGTMTVTIDDEDTDLDKAFTLVKPDVNITFDPFVVDVGEQIILDTGLFKFSVVAVKAFEDQVSGYNRGHLDLETEVSRPPGALDGVVGHSLYVRPEDHLHQVQERKFHNQETDYIVSGLFDAMDLEVQQATSRRRRLIEGASDSSLEFPIRSVMRW